MTPRCICSCIQFPFNEASCAYEIKCAVLRNWKTIVLRNSSDHQPQLNECRPIVVHSRKGDPYKLTIIIHLPVNLFGSRNVLSNSWSGFCVWLLAVRLCLSKHDDGYGLTSFDSTPACINLCQGRVKNLRGSQLTAERRDSKRFRKEWNMYRSRINKPIEMGRDRIYL